MDRRRLVNASSGAARADKNTGVKRRRDDGRLSRILLVITIVFLVAISGWWASLLGRLAGESYALAVQIHGDNHAATQVLARRRTMIMWESFAFSCVPVILLALSWRGAERERQQQSRLEAMLAASTHELKTPVAGLRALLESLKSGVLPAADAGPHLDQGLAACDRLERLAESITVRQAVLAGASPVERRKLGDLLDEVQRHRLVDSGVTYDLGDAAEVVLALPENAFRSVVDNLLDNAMRHADGKGVAVRARREGEHVMVEVLDGGRGFVPSEAESLFEPYRRGAGRTERRGTGLGLFLARTLAREMGGTLTGESEGPGRGATFRLRLPGKPA